MGDWSNKIIARMRDRLENEVDSIGVDMVADIRQKISIPVEYLESGAVVRSDPYDYPRREFGNLWQSESHQVTAAGPVIILNVSNTAAYARRLHDGHDNVAPRPFHDKAMVEWRPEIRQRSRDAIVGKR